jgi:uncharacterized protein YbaA (DUF1428 family)
MAVYVDGYLLPVPKKNIDKYRKMATVASKVWKEHGALEYKECLADDVKPKGMPSFLKAVKAKKGETVFFSYIVYKSKAHRDQVNKKVMKDPRITAMMPENSPMPFDHKRMFFGGFKALVEA